MFVIVTGIALPSTIMVTSCPLAIPKYKELNNSLIFFSFQKYKERAVTSLKQ